MFRRGGACPSRLVSEFLRSTPGGSSCGSARRAVALYECHGPRRTGGSGDPPLRGVRRNTAKPDNGRDKPLPYGVVERDSPAEDRRAHGTLCWGPPAAAIVGGSASPTRTLCHGWSETGAAVEPYQPKFCTVSGPSGPGGMKPFWKTGGRIRRSAPTTPQVKYSRTGGRAATWGRPYGGSGRSQQDEATGGASPSPTGWRGNILRRKTGGRNPVRRRAGSSRPTGITVHGGRVGQETRPYGAISVMRDVVAAPTGVQADRSRTGGWAGSRQQAQKTGRTEAAGF